MTAVNGNLGYVYKKYIMTTIKIINKYEPKYTEEDSIAERIIDNKKYNDNLPIYNYDNNGWDGTNIPHEFSDEKKNYDKTMKEIINPRGSDIEISAGNNGGNLIFNSKETKFPVKDGGHTVFNVGGNLIFNVNGISYKWPTNGPERDNAILMASVKNVNNIQLYWKNN